ncbi:MAG: hypothetical protein WD066_11675 [Planctomycetaceae bacterium]
MQKRERILLFVVVALALGWFIIPKAHGLLVGPVAEREQRLAALQERLNKQRVDETKLLVAGRILEAARARSLPRNVDDAQRLYGDWVYALADIADFDGIADSDGPRGPEVKAASRKLHGSVFTAVSVTVAANATLEQLGRFLHAFHRTDLPHRIDAIELTATGDKPDLPVAVKLTATALAFRDGPDRAYLFPRTTLAADLKSDRKTLEVAETEGFPDKPDFRVRIGREYLTVTAMEGNRWTVARAVDDTRPQSHDEGDYLELAPINPGFADVAPADYYGKLAKNSPFAKPQPKVDDYKRPDPPPDRGTRVASVPTRRDPPPEPDPAAKFTYFGSFVQYDERPQVRLYDRRNGELTVLHEGERFEIGTIEGKVASIDYDHVVITNHEGTYRLPLGETLVYMEKVAGPPASAIAARASDSRRRPDDAPVRDDHVAGPPEPPTVPVELPAPADGPDGGEPIKAESALDAARPPNGADAPEPAEEADPDEAPPTNTDARFVAEEAETVDAADPPLTSTAAEEPDAR